MRRYPLVLAIAYVALAAYTADGSAAPLTVAEELALRPKDAFKECDDCPEMVVVPAGSYTMGSPQDELERSPTESQVRVTFAKPFAVGRFAVTRGEFAAFVSATARSGDRKCWIGVTVGRSEGDWRSPGFVQTDRHPVVCITWDDAKAYAAWLSSVTGKTYRLLSEAEREYVARAGTTTAYWWGSKISEVEANYGNDARAGDPQVDKATLPVNSFMANPWGLYNVHGNVWDWTEDCWTNSNAGNPGDGSARSVGPSCSYRVVRGGSWKSTASELRAAFRSRRTPIGPDRGIGVRVARTL